MDAGRLKWDATADCFIAQLKRPIKGHDYITLAPYHSSFSKGLYSAWLGTIGSIRIAGPLPLAELKPAVDGWVASKLYGMETRG